MKNICPVVMDPFKTKEETKRTCLKQMEDQRTSNWSGFPCGFPIKEQKAGALEKKTRPHRHVSKLGLGLQQMVFV